MKNLLILVAVFFTFTASLSVMAQSTLTPRKLKIKLKSIKKPISGDIDKEITNSKIRTESGSKSRWSMSSTLSYSGSSIKKPFDDKRPNINKKSVPPYVSLGGDISGRYRFNKSDSITLGAGISFIKPFHGGNTSYMNDPFARFTRAYKYREFQMMTSVGLNYTTDPGYTKLGDFGTISLSQYLVSPIAKSRLSLGLGLGIYYTHFDKPTLPGQGDYGGTAYPFLEYRISDMFSFRTVWGVYFYRHLKTESALTFDKFPIYQTIGIGTALTRDIYLYPYINFTPEHISADQSTVNISASINVF